MLYGSTPKESTQRLSEEGLLRDRVCSSRADVRRRDQVRRKDSPEERRARYITLWFVPKVSQDSGTVLVEKVEL